MVKKEKGKGKEREKKARVAFLFCPLCWPLVGLCELGVWSRKGPF